MFSPRSGSEITLCGWGSHAFDAARIARFDTARQFDHQLVQIPLIEQTLRLSHSFPVCISESAILHFVFNQPTRNSKLAQRTLGVRVPSGGTQYAGKGHTRSFVTRVPADGDLELLDALVVLSVRPVGQAQDSMRL